MVFFFPFHISHASYFLIRLVANFGVNFAPYGQINFISHPSAIVLAQVHERDSALEAAVLLEVNYATLHRV